MAKVINAKGEEVGFLAACFFMDPSIANELADGDPTNPASGWDGGTWDDETWDREGQQEFFRLYAEAHEKKYGEGFAPWTGEWGREAD